MNRQIEVITPTIDGMMGRSPPHESAHLHVSGEAAYVDDLPEHANALHAALGLSARARAKICSMDLEVVRQHPGVIEVLTAKDIPGTNDCGPIVHDDPILADAEVFYIGQPIFLVVAQTRRAAREAARLATINYEDLTPLLDPRTAASKGEHVVPPLRLICGQPQEEIAKAPRRFSGSFSVGGQEQFYLEGQIAYAVPTEDDGIHLFCSTQHPTEMQHVVAHALNLSAHQVVVEMRRMGGGFGGKESQSALFCALAAVAARRTGCPVKLRPDRDDDFLITGKRHDFEYTYEVGVDDQGQLLGSKVEMIARGGFSADLSGPVITRALCHFDNAYYLANADIKVIAARTNTQSNTAFRGFGGPQGAFAIEYIIDDIAREFNLDPLEIRRRNFYGIGERNVTPYGQIVRDNILPPLISELEKTSDYQHRRQSVRDFNANSPVLKKGLALTPVKFGISFNVKHFNQAGALVHVYTDGSVMVSHGGTEMGQGLNTKVAQVVASVLGLPVSAVKATAADTSKVPNTSATAASTGTDLNGKAAEDAAQQIRHRLAVLLSGQYGGAAENVGFAHSKVSVNGHTFAFAEVCRLAYEARVQLWSDGFYATPDIHWDRVQVRGSPFYYFAYGASVSEVVLDTLTGEWRLLRADLLHDVGQSLNPAIDLGQIEGAYIQGMGWLTLEELWWNDAGKLMTHAPSTYKIPAVHDCPPIFNTRLFERPNPVPTIFRSKAVGEPPLLLSFSVFFAIRDAIASLGGYRKNPPLCAPATPEAILQACMAMGSL